MKKHIKTSIEIKADRKLVWQILTDFEHYPEWNPFVQSITGEVVVGKRISIQLEKMKFQPMVLAFEEQKTFEWLGHLWIKGLFDGQHKFALTDLGDGKTLFEHSEYFSGMLVRFFERMLDTTTIQGFERMNVALKSRAESIA